MSIMGKRNQGNGNGLPRATNMPPVPAHAAHPPQAMQHVTPHYDEEVLRVAQRDYDNKCKIAELSNECDEWRRKCLASEEQNRRLESRIERDEQAHMVEINNLTDQRDRKIEELTQQRDQYKVKLTRFETKISMIGEALIKLASNTSEMTSKLLEEIRADQGRQDTIAEVNGLSAVANAIEESATPKFFAADPRAEDHERTN